MPSRQLTNKQIADNELACGQIGFEIWKPESQKVATARPERPTRIADLTGRQQATPCSLRPEQAVAAQVDTEHGGMNTQTNPIDGSNPLVTDQEACEYLRIRQRQLYTWRMQGVIPFIRIGRSIRYRLRDLDAAIDALTVVSLPQATGHRLPEPTAPSVNPTPATSNLFSHESN
jgi:excisionase family DNA binding protein